MIKKRLPEVHNICDNETKTYYDEFMALLKKNSAAIRDETILKLEDIFNEAVSKACECAYIRGNQDRAIMKMDGKPSLYLLRNE